MMNEVLLFVQLDRREIIVLLKKDLYQVLQTYLQPKPTVMDMAVTESIALDLMVSWHVKILM